MVQEEVILGHVIYARGIKVDKAKIEVIKQLPPPTFVKGGRSFLNHAEFNRRFIKDFSRIAKPLTQPLAKDAPFVFFDECHEAFCRIKQALIFCSQYNHQIGISLLKSCSMPSTM